MINKYYAGYKEIFLPRMKRLLGTSAEKSYFPSLLNELDLGHIKLKNRILMGSMHTNLEEAGFLGLFGNLNELAAYFGERFI